jgi:FlaG/FlaF family flagellin (archaellin)
MKNVRKITKLRRSIKAISPVISVLLMIAIAVVASLVVYAWIMGYIGGNTTKAGKAIQIQSYAPDGNGNLTIYVQNVGQGTVDLQQNGGVYINDQMYPITSSALTIAEGQTVALTVALPTDDQITIKVVTADGTFSQTTGPLTGQVVVPTPTPTPTPTPAPTLDHFEFSTINSPQTAGSAFSVTITAKDQYGDDFSGYSGTNTLSASTGTGTIIPTSITIASGTWAGQVTLSQAGTGVTLSTDGGGKSGTSNSFNVNAASLPAIYVTSNNVVHDNPNVGTHSSFANMQDDGSYDTLSESDVGSAQTWVTPTGDSGSTWSSRSNAHDGSTSTSAYDDISSNSWSSTLTLSYPSTTGTEVRYWVNREDSHIDTIQIDVYNTGTSSWQTVYSGAPTIGNWAEVSFTSRTTNQMRISFHNNYDHSRTAYVNEAQVLSVAPANYRLDLEIQFSGVTNFASYTQLQIKTGTLDTENLAVYYWSGSSWQQLTNALNANAVNTLTVALSGQTFDLKFVDTTQSGDTTQSSWQIDYVRLVAP